MQRLCLESARDRSSSTLWSAADSVLIHATLAALRDERRRALADLLAILTLLVAAAGLMRGIGIAYGEGVAREVFLSLTGEVLGVASTVGIIGGLWQQLRNGSRP